MTPDCGVATRSGDGAPDALQRAREVAARERRLLATEREAFERFRSLVAAVDVAPAAAPRRTVHGSTAGGGRPSLTAVRRAYERTVMDTPHYDAEYGDGYRRSLAVEFGVDVATALTGGGSFTPRLREVVTAAAAEAATERTALLDLVEREEAAVSAASESLADLDRRIDRLTDRRLATHDFEDLRRLRARLSAVVPDLDAVAADRQAALSDYRRGMGADCPDLPEYLYADESFAYPVLGAVARRGRAVAAGKRRVLRAMTRRD
jgi:hypothetical protein